MPDSPAGDGMPMAPLKQNKPSKARDKPALVEESFIRPGGGMSIPYYKIKIRMFIFTTNHDLNANICCIIFLSVH